MTADCAARKTHARATAETQHRALVALSDRIHADPEVAWQEYHASAWVAELLSEHGFDTKTGAFGLDTAVHASFGSGSRAVALVAEYDALPGLGHACGHNLIAASSVGAALALAPLADDLDLRVELYGTPAEEGGGGKIEMLDRGAFADVDLAMMAHPAPVDVAEARPFAVSHAHITYDGIGAHAGAYPEEGVNANDAFVIAQVAIGLLRQQLPAGTRVHGIQTIGGSAPNAIPAHTEGRWYVRAETLEHLLALDERVRRCFEAGALATGTTLTITPESQPYSEFRTAQAVLGRYVDNARSLGRVFSEGGTASQMSRASTDMGNVSQVVPAIHPYIGLDTRGAGNHQPEFADACIGADAEKLMHDASIALAWTAIDVFDTH